MLALEGRLAWNIKDWQTSFLEPIDGGRKQIKKNDFLGRRQQAHN